MKIYIALTPLFDRGKNKHIEPGREIKLDDQSAGILLAKGCIEAVSKQEKPAPELPEELE